MRKNTEKFNYLFGPVPSRRLGLSLGVDLVPCKTCTLDCVYCESGKTTTLTTDRKMYVSVKSVINELSDYLSTEPALDYITFSGSGEPTLNAGISEVIGFIKKHHPQYKIALLTNGTLFDREDVQNDVLDVDLIIASLDAVSEKAFSAVNRPAQQLDIMKIIEGLALFREKYRNDLWIEVFIVPGKNDSDDELLMINNAVMKIRPDKLQLNTLDRPGVEDWVEAAGTTCLRRVAAMLTAAEIINSAELQEAALVGEDDIEQRILGLIQRRPCTLNDFVTSLGISSGKAEERLKKLVGREVITCEKMERGIFYKPAVS